MDSHTDRAVLCAGDFLEIFFSHISKMFEDTKMRSGLYRFFHIALLNDFGSFALWMSDNLFESAHCSTASPSLSVVVYPQRVVWLLKSPITMCGLILCPSGGSRNGSGGGLYRYCTTTPGSSTVINSTVINSTVIPPNSHRHYAISARNNKSDDINTIRPMDSIQEFSYLEAGT